MALKRNKPMKRTPMKRGGRPKSRSAKRAAQQKRRLSSWEPGETRCDVQCSPHCTGLAEGLHERRKAGQGGTREPGQNTIPSCNMCNVWIEDEPKLARQCVAVDGRSLVVRDGDPEWEELGAKSYGR